MVLLAHAEAYRDLNDLGAPGRPTKTQKYTLHRSLKSPLKLNTIKHTLLLQDNTEITTAQITLAIKSGRAFAHLFTSQRPDLSNERYGLKSSDNHVTLDRYDPRSFIIYYGIFVGAPEKIFRMPTTNRPSGINLYQHRFQHFRITIMWTFAPGLSNSDGTLLHVATQKPPQPISPEAIPTGFIEGFGELQALHAFSASVLSLQHAALAFVKHQYAEVFDTAREFADLGFFRNGNDRRPVSKAFKDGKRRRHSGLLLPQHLISPE